MEDDRLSLEAKTMTRIERAAVAQFGVAMAAIGVLGLVLGDFAMQWQPVAPWFPARTALAYSAGVLEVVCGAALLSEKTSRWAIRVLFPWAAVWFLLKVPGIVAAPGVEGSWLGAGEIGVLLAGTWTLFARLGDVDEGSALGWLAGERGVRAARYLFAVSLLPIGLSHFVYVKETADLVPAWLPYRTGWAYLTGAGQIASGLGVLLGVLPRVAAWAEAAQITIFTLLIWVPAAATGPGVRLNWTAVCISWTIGAGAWVVAAALSSPQRSEHAAEAKTTEPALRLVR